jgi:cell division protein FtsI/penicillin-binding protein 2
MKTMARLIGQWWLPMPLAFLNRWLFDALVWRGHIQLMIAQTYSGILLVLLLGYLANVAKPSTHDIQPAALASAFGCLAWVKALAWTAGWVLACVFLPVDGLVRVFALSSFLVLAFASADGATPIPVPKEVIRKAIILCVTIGFALTVTVLIRRPFVVQRITSDFGGPLDLEGRHFIHGQILKMLMSLQPFGDSLSSLPDRLSQFANLSFLKLAAETGVVPAAILAAVTLVMWVVIYRWLSHTSCGTSLTPAHRRMGLALVWFHGITWLINVFWNLGLVRQAWASGLPPFMMHPSWWILSTAMVWVFAHAYQQRRQLPSESRPPSRNAGLGAYSIATISAFTLLLFVARVGQQTANELSQPKYLAYTRLDVLDSAGETIAETIAAFDISFRPHEFWSPSLANPKQADESTSDEARLSRLLATLSPWPQVRTLVSGKLSLYSKADTSIKTLAWAVSPEVAHAVNGLRMPGLTVTPRPARRYPKGELFSHAIGFVNLSDITKGQDGLELALNSEISILQYTVDRGHAPVHTTLDSQVQALAREALYKEMKETRAVGGAAVVMSASTGEILASVSLPDFNPDDAQTFRNPYDPTRILNRAIASQFKIGDLIQPLVLAQILETSDISPALIPRADNKSYPFGKMQLSAAEFSALSKTLGLGESLASPGLLGGAYKRSDWSQWTSEMFAQPGKHIETNLTQLTKAYLPIATGGVMRSPTMLARKINFSGVGDMYLLPDIVLTVGTAKAVWNAMKTSVEGIPVIRKLQEETGFTVAGARYYDVGDVNLVNRNRNESATFIGMVPADEPIWMVAVLLQYSADSRLKPGPNTHGSAHVFDGIVRGLVTRQ